MADVVSADDWRLFVLCLAVATVAFVLAPEAVAKVTGLAVIVAGIFLYMIMLVVEQKLRTSYGSE